MALGTVRRTLGISCERPVCSTLVCFIPLLDVPVAPRAMEFTPGRGVGEEGLLGVELTAGGTLLLEQQAATVGRASARREQGIGANREAHLHRRSSERERAHATLGSGAPRG